MCKVIKLGFAVLLLFVAVVVCCDDQALSLVLEKTAEGVAGGMMFGLLSGFDKWLRVRDRAGFSLWRFRCVLAREVKGGLCAGFLVGQALSLIAVFSR
jgi:hypothetical protein